MQRRLSLLLAIVMIIAVCLPNALAEETDRFGKYEELLPVTYLNTHINLNAVAEFDENNPDRKSEYENAWITGYKDYLNIKLERIIAEDDTALNAMLNTGMASGDLPDIMLVSKDMFYVLAENGVLADLSEAYENYEYKNHLLQIEQSYPGLLELGMYDGQMLGYPKVGNCYNATDVLWVRTDWLEKVDKKLPTTWDEMLEVARAFKEAKLGGENTIGIALSATNNGGNSSWASVIGLYGSVIGTWMEQEDGSYVLGDVMVENVSQGLLEMQKLYAEGLIREDFAVTDFNDGAFQDVANGLTGLVITDVTQGVQSIQTSLNNDPEAAWYPVAMPTLDGNPVKMWTNASVGSYYVVNAECENPEALFKLIEFETSMRFSEDPAESARFNVCEDTYQMWALGAFRDTVRADTDLYKGELIAEGFKNNTPVEEMDALALSNYQLCIDAKNGNRTYLGRLVAFVDGYAITIPMLEAGLLCPAYNGPITETMTLYEENLKEALRSAMVKVVMGEDISVYEEAVEAWYANGGQTITDEVNAYYASIK